MRRFFQAIGRGLARFFKAIWRFIKRHKKLSVFLLVLIIGASTALVILSRMRSSTQTGGFSMPETTMLAKMDIELTVTATGTLQSTTVEEVTSELSYDIEAVYVEVGDAVEAGQLLCTLDPTDLNETIADLREDIADAVAQDEKDLDRLATTLQEAIDKREKNWNTNEAAVQAAHAAIEQARVNAGNQAGNQALERQATQDAEAAARAAVDANSPNSFTELLEAAQKKADEAQIKLESAIATGTGLDDAITANNLAQENLKQAQQDWDKAYNDAYNSEYQASKSRNHDSIFVPAYNNAYNNANVSAETSTYEKAISTRDTAYENDTKSIETAQQNYDDQAEKDSAEDLREQLEDYLDQKDELSIISPISGIVMDMTAAVGKSAGGAGSSSGTSGMGDTGTATSGGALFTIENKNSLEIPVSVAEYDAVGMAEGLSATVTSDALEDEEWSATVSSVSPKASDGYFTVTVEITSPVGDLAVGMSATVDIITESRTNVYAVPYDAVVTNSAGQTVVYALETGGFGGMPGGASGDMDFGSIPEGGFENGERPEGMPDFEGADGTSRGTGSGEDFTSEENRIEIVVETGLETDYYIEISGEDLRDGLMILNDPLGNNVTATPSEDETGGFGGFGGGGGGMPGGGGGGGMPGGGGGGMPGGGGGGMPGGGGGGMPGGG